MIRRGPLAVLSTLIFLAGFCTVFHFGGVRVNASPSLPIGLYRITSDKWAKLIEFCPAEPFASLSARRGYRKKGGCPDGAEPLLKPIVAVAGDIVENSRQGVAVNGQLLANSTARPFDTKDRPLRNWPFGEYRVAAGTVWVISSFNPRSFDSRYFGPISISSVRAHLRPLLTE
jgi:conjugative transfer signal peptidase TraF